MSIIIKVVGSSNLIIKGDYTIIKQIPCKTMNKKDKKHFKQICNTIGMKFIEGKRHKKLLHSSGATITVSGTASCPFYKSHVIKDIKRLLLEKEEFENLKKLQKII